MSSSPSAFILIDVQEGFKHPTHWGPERSNPEFESNAESLLTAYRSLVSSSNAQNAITNPHLLIHVNHSSLLRDSELHPDSPGFAFQSFARPKVGEMVITKHVNSSFIGTDLEHVLRTHFAQFNDAHADGNEGDGHGEPYPNGTIYLAGLTTDHCVSTTTRMASNLRIVTEGHVVFVGDATAAWKKSEDSPWDAETVHDVNQESLKEFADIRYTAQVLEEWRDLGSHQK